jgi:hypothetical protein
MAVLTKFIDDTDEVFLKPVLVIVTETKHLSICIKYEKVDESENVRFISLNKQSAIKLAKELRKQISFLED